MPKLIQSILLIQLAMSSHSWIAYWQELLYIRDWGADFISKTPGGIANNAISTIARRLFGKDADVLLRPDLVSPLTREVYEIKTVNQQALGTTELALYITELNAITPPGAPQWQQGTSYIPPKTLFNVWRGFDAVVFPPEAGVITYNLEDPGGGGDGDGPGGNGILHLVAVASAASLALALGVGLLISARGPGAALI